MTLPAHLITLRDEAMRTTCEAWAMRKRWKLAKGIDRAGPCPECGGNDRFAIHTKMNTFNCRQCELRGGGVIDLVMKTENVDFTRACEIITGRAASDPVDPNKAAQLAAQAGADATKRAQDQESYRENARKAGFAIWSRAKALKELPNTIVAYLALRGIDLDVILALPNTTHSLPIRIIVNHQYTVKVGDEWQVVHRGPTMVAAVQRADGSFGAAHQTWIDVSRPKGKAVLGAIDGKELPVKVVRGSKKGGAIRLYTPVQPRRLVVGEGIETTLTALAHAFEPDTAYWAAVDIGNMHGRALRDADGKQVHDQPDMADVECFVPPEWCRELVYLGEGDDGDLNEQKLTRGLRRAMRTRAGLTASIVPAPGAGQDLNDLVMRSAPPIEEVRPE